MIFWSAFMLGAAVNAILVILFEFLQERRELLDKYDVDNRP